MNLTLKKIAEYTGGELYGNACAVVTNAIIDSRKATKDSLFIALKGENTDGHRFVSNAFESGASCALIQKGCIKLESDNNYVEVANVEKAMGDIAAGIIRDRGDSLLKLAVTGSVGKTSTKDMIAFVFEEKHKTLKSHLNNNNELGLPLTVMKLESDHDVIVTEMGMRGLGQIEYLTNIVKPDIAVITNICISHLETLGTRENILRAKLEVCKGMNADSTLILNGDNDMLLDKKNVMKIIDEYGVKCPNIVYFGTESNSDYVAEEIHGSNYMLLTPDGKKFQMNLKVPGVHNVYNSMAAVCAACASGICVEDAVRIISEFGENVSRQKIIEKKWGFIIDDTYNAGPESMEASLSVLKEIKADVKIAALGDMLELGVMMKDAHSKVGKVASDCADVLLAVGDNSMIYYQEFTGDNKLHVNDSKEGAAQILDIVKGFVDSGKSIAVLAKGSHAMKMNEISEVLLNYGG